MFSAAPKSKLKVSLLESLVDSQELPLPFAADVISQELDALKYGHSVSWYILEGFARWYETDYKHLKLSATREEKLLFDKLKVYVDWIQQKIEKFGNRSQAHLAEQLAIFYGRHADLPNREANIKRLKKSGQCGGFSFLDTLAIYNGCKRHFEQLAVKIAKWNGKDNSLNALKKEIIEYVELVLNAQDSRTKLALLHLEWPKIQRAIGRPSLTRKIELNAVMTLPVVSATTAKEVIDQVYLPAVRRKKAPQYQTVSVAAYSHASVIHDMGRYIRYLDPNCMTGAVRLKDAKGLPTLIQASHHATKDDVIAGDGDVGVSLAPSSLLVRLYGQKNEPLKISMPDFSSEIKIPAEHWVIYGICNHDRAVCSYWTPKADINVTAESGYTYFHFAAMSNYADFIKDRPSGVVPDMNARTDLSKRTALHIAARFGFVDVVEALFARQEAVLDVDARILSTDSKHPDWTALHLAAKYGHIAVVEKIILHSPKSLNVLTRVGEDSLAIAIKYGHTKLSKILADKLFTVAVAEDDKAKISALIKTGLVDLHPALTATPLHRAAGQGSVSEVKALLAVPDIQPDARITDKNSPFYGWTPLHLAVKEGRLEVIKLILFKHPRSLHVRTPNGKDALGLAHEKGDVRVYRVLAQHKLYGCPNVLARQTFCEELARSKQQHARQQHPELTDSKHINVKLPKFKA